MAIEDVYSIQGRGTVVTGRVEQGRVKVGDAAEICGLKPTLSTVVTGVEMFHKSMNEGQAGDNVGLLLRGVKREEVLRGQLVAKPKSVHHQLLPAVLRADGGRVREDHAAEGEGDGDARRQQRDDRRAAEARGAPRGTALRAARWRKDHRRRRGEQDFGLQCLLQETSNGKRITST